MSKQIGKAIRRGNWTARLEFEPRDVWVGVFWKRIVAGGEDGLAFYVCILPMLPLVFERVGGEAEGRPTPLP